MSNINEKQTEKTLNRREFFQRAAVLGVMAAGAGSVLAACEKGGGGGAATDKAPAKKAEGGGAAADKGGGGELNCMDTTGLDPAGVKVRESLQYVDKTPKADQDCANCLHYKPAAEGECGGCAVVPGPIHPKGWCTAWVAQA